MARSDIKIILSRIEYLANEINQFVPSDTRAIQFRADLAGLLVVSIAAAYESCIKDTLTNFASRHHVQFGTFAQNHFERLNSRINMADLYKYTQTFDGNIHRKFGSLIKARKDWFVRRLGRDFTKEYSQILSWRHDFAHAGVRNTTVEEAMITHGFAKRVLYAFDDAFS